MPAHSSRPSDRPRRPARGRGGKPAAGSSRAGQRPQPRRTEPSALDLALTAALERPAPPSRTFAQLGLPQPLVTALARRGVHEPFAIQTRAIPDALDGRDVLGRAQTGSGKTLAFGIPMLTRLSAARTGRTP